MYDICFRAIQGLPLPARSLTNFLIQSIMARLIFTEQVILCNYVWMANHVHMQAVSLDSNAFTNFHGQLKKRLSDFLKRLLALPHLTLWAERSNIGEVLDLDAAIERVVYSFLNPVRAKLVRSIDNYKGLNTWKEFLSSKADLNTVIEKEVPWVLAPDLEPLSQRNPSWSEERRVLEDLQEKASSRETHTLRIYPFKWLEAFGISDPDEIEKIRTKIVSKVREEEAKLAPQKEPVQRIEGFVVTDEYIPTKKERRVFMYGSTLARRLAHLDLYRWFVGQCRYCYQLMKEGCTSIPWPPGCFIPPAPQLLNVF
jgi:hypothetical protein